MCHGIVGTSNFKRKDRLGVFAFEQDRVVQELYKLYARRVLEDEDLDVVKIIIEKQ